MSLRFCLIQLKRIATCYVLDLISVLLVFVSNKGTLTITFNIQIGIELVSYQELFFNCSSAYKETHLSQKKFVLLKM